MADDGKKRIEEVNEELGALQEGLLSITNSLSNKIKEAIEDIRDESAGVAQIFEKKISRDIKNIAKDSEKFLSNTQKLADGSAKVSDIVKQMKDLELKRLNVSRSLTILQNNGVLTAEERQKQERELLQAYMIQHQMLAEQVVEAAKLEEKLGLTGKVLKGISKIPLLSNVVDTKKALEAAAQSSTKIGAMGAALKSVGKDVLKNITDPLTIATFVIGALYKTLIDVDKKSGEFAKSMNISYSDAVSLREEFKKVGDATNDAFVNSRSMSESLMAINSALGTSARLSNEELVIFTKLREEAGYTNEELASMQRLTLSMGGTLEGNVKKFAGTVQLLNAQNKLSINEKQLMKDISKTSDAIKLSVGGTVKNIAEAAFKAKQFGISLEQADRISESLLDFESSISNELSAELITGKNLNLEKARLLALNGKVADAAAEILQQVGGTAEFTKMNRIQQEALAKAVGMSREDLAASLVEREALARLGIQEGNLQKEYNKMKAAGLTQDQIAARLGNESLAKQLAQTSNAEKMAALVEKLKDAFIPIAEQILPKINAALEFFGKHIDAIEATIIGIGTFMATKMLMGLIANVTQAGILAEESTVTALAQQLNARATIQAAVAQGTLTAEQAAGALAASEGAIASLTTAGAVSGGIGLIPIMAAVGAAIAGFVALKSMKDGHIAPDGGLVVSGPKGMYSLDPNDHVIAGTDLGRRNTSTSYTPQQDLSPLLEEMRALRQEQSRSNSKPTVIENTVNGTRFGTAVAMNTYKIQ